MKLPILFANKGIKLSEHVAMDYFERKGNGWVEAKISSHSDILFP